jgi:hypothetical protein
MESGSNRDIILLSEKLSINHPQAVMEMRLLNSLLTQAEQISVIASAHEIIDLNRYKIINKPLIVQHSMTEKKEKPFIFVSCKN